MSVVIAITLYFYLGSELTEGFEVSPHAVLRKLPFGLGFILLANIFYAFGATIDTRMNSGGIERVSHLIWNIVFWCSVLIPFVMPGSIIAEKYDLYTALGL